MSLILHCFRCGERVSMLYPRRAAIRGQQPQHVKLCHPCTQAVDAPPEPALRSRLVNGSEGPVRI